MPVAPSSADAADQVVGVASVIDGAPVEIHGDRIHFDGSDAPGSSQMVMVLISQRPWLTSLN
jgi:hypothetical protein